MRLKSLISSQFTSLGGRALQVRQERAGVAVIRGSIDVGDRGVGRRGGGERHGEKVGCPRRGAGGNDIVIPGSKGAAPRAVGGHEVESVEVGKGMGTVGYTYKLRAFGRVLGGNEGLMRDLSSFYY